MSYSRTNNRNKRTFFMLQTLRTILLNSSEHNICMRDQRHVLLKRGTTLPSFKGQSSDEKLEETNVCTSQETNYLA